MGVAHFPLTLLAPHGLISLEDPQIDLLNTFLIRLWKTVVP